METRRDVFQAIADPTRRAIIGMIAKEPVNVNTIAAQFDVSRQAISLHLKILSECGLLHIAQSGRERLCEVKLEKLNEVHEWVTQYHSMWTDKLNSLKAFLAQEEKNEHLNKKTPKRVTHKKTNNGQHKKK